LLSVKFPLLPSVFFFGFFLFPPFAAWSRCPGAGIDRFLISIFHPTPCCFFLATLHLPAASLPQFFRLSRFFSVTILYFHGTTEPPQASTCTNQPDPGVMSSWPSPVVTLVSIAASTLFFTPPFYSSSAVRDRPWSSDGGKCAPQPMASFPTQVSAFANSFNPDILYKDALPFFVNGAPWDFCSLSAEAPSSKPFLY